MYATVHRSSSVRPARCKLLGSAAGLQLEHVHDNLPAPVWLLWTLWLQGLSCRSAAHRWGCRPRPERRRLRQARAPQPRPHPSPTPGDRSARRPTKRVKRTRQRSVAALDAHGTRCTQSSHTQAGPVQLQAAMRMVLEDVGQVGARLDDEGCGGVAAPGLQLSRRAVHLLHLQVELPCRPQVSLNRK